MEKPEERYFLIKLSDFEKYEKNSDHYAAPSLRKHLLRMEAPEPLAKMIMDRDQIVERGIAEGLQGLHFDKMFNQLPEKRPFYSLLDAQEIDQVASDALSIHTADNPNHCIRALLRIVADMAKRMASKEN